MNVAAGRRTGSADAHPGALSLEESACNVTSQLLAGTDAFNN